MTLETFIDNLRDGYAKLEPGTMLHADQLMAAQVHDPDLQNESFYVADGPLYSLEGKQKTPTLWLTREPNNLVLHHLNDTVNSSYDQLIDVNNGNFRPNLQEARKAMRAKGTLRIDLTKLCLQDNEEESQYLEIPTADYKTLNAEERKLAERWYGQGKRFARAMETLNEVGISAANVYVLAPDYVRKEAQKGPVGRASWLGDFGYSGAGANYRLINFHLALRGVRRVVAPQLSERGEESHERFPKGKSRVKRLESASGVTRGRTQPSLMLREEQLLVKLRPYLKQGMERKAGRTIRNFLK